MRWPWRRGRPEQSGAEAEGMVMDGVEQEEVSDEVETDFADELTVSEQLGPSTKQGQISTQAFLIAVLVAIVCGPVGLWLAVLRPEAAPVATQQVVAEDDSARDQAAIAGAATELAYRWGSATAETMDDVAASVGAPAAEAPPKARSQVSDVTAVAVYEDSTTAGLWRVELIIRGGLAGRGGRYLVLVDTRGPSPTAVTLPGQVPASALADRLDEAGTKLGAQHPLATASVGWVTAMVGGGGDLARWMSPETPEVTPLEPVCESPTTTTQLLVDEATPDTEELAEPVDGTAVRVITTFTCPQVSTGQYVLDLRARDGRWEVTTFTGAQNGAATPTPTPTQPSATPTS